MVESNIDGLNNNMNNSAIGIENLGDAAKIDNNRLQVQGAKWP